MRSIVSRGQQFAHRPFHRQPHLAVGQVDGITFGQQVGDRGAVVVLVHQPAVYIGFSSHGGHPPGKRRGQACAARWRALDADRGHRTTGRTRPLCENPAGSAPAQGLGRTSPRPGDAATGRDTGTAVGRRHQCRWPGYVRSATDISTPRTMPAGWPAPESAVDQHRRSSFRAGQGNRIRDLRGAESVPGRAESLRRSRTEALTHRGGRRRPPLGPGLSHVQAGTHCRADPSAD